MTIRHFILATAGHIDHGKSSLVQKLTGTDPDRLPEEKLRGVTIDLGFAAFVPNPTLSIGIVDVPGHEDFVKNMVAGVGAIDAALLVVAADDGWMPQTEEHLQILQYLNVRHGIIALSKSDRVDLPRFNEAIADVRKRVAATFLAESPIVPTSIHSSGGLENLQAAIVAMFDGMPVPVDIGKPRMQIDRSFLLRGVGRVVTGTLSGGTLRRAQNIMISPSMTVSKIRTIQSHNRNHETAPPSTRVALNLPDLPASGEWRGQTVTLASLAAPHDTIDVQLHFSKGKMAHRNGVVQVHHGTQSVRARIILFQDTTLAQLRLDSPLAAFVGDRLILRDAAQQKTIAGATVLDPAARRSGTQHADRQAFLSACASGIDDVELVTLATIVFYRTVKRSDLLLQSHFSQAAIDAGVDRLKHLGRVVVAGEFIIAGEWWKAALDQVGEKIRAFHDAHPEKIGIPLASVRSLMPRELAKIDVLDVVVGDLLKRGFTRVDAFIRHQDHRPRLPERLSAAGNRIRAALQLDELNPPPRAELTPDVTAQQSLAFLKATGEAIELSPQVVISAVAFAEASERVRHFLSVHLRATVTELKTAMGTSRRVAVPLLEKLDQMGVTRRDGDMRQLR